MMNCLTNTRIALLCATLMLSGTAAQAENYRLDPAHSFVEFSISHLGFSILKGRFNTLSGQFSYDAAMPTTAKITVEVDTASIDSNHAERDKHLRSKDFLDVESFPKATFVSTAFQEKDGQGTLTGTFTLHGVSKDVSIPVRFVGAGDDPWGGYRRGYTGQLRIKRSDYGISKNLGPTSEEMDLLFSIEGIRE